MIYPWLKPAWQRLQETRGQLHHALLVHGPAGIGKRRFAEVFAQSLVCASPGEEGFPCGQCADCRWFGQGTHPDFRLLTPESLRADSANSDDAASEDSVRGERKASSQITIEQVRELQELFSLTAHKTNGYRVVLIQPAETMNAAASNALLKVLEEPPPRSVFLLVTDDIRRLLPTTLSRCRRYPLPAVDRKQALDWLKTQGLDDAEVLLAQAGGAPVTALALADSEGREERRQFLDQLTRLAGPGTALELATAAQKIPLQTVMRWLLTWCYDLMAARLAGTVRYHLDYSQQISSLAPRLAMDQWLIYQDLLRTAARAVAHPLNPRLFLEQLLLSYSQAITTSSIRGHD